MMPRVVLSLSLPLLLPVSVVMLLSGCAGGWAVQTAPPEPAFGSTTRAALALQIANPDVARQAQARGHGQAAGMDGRAASQAQGRYQKSFGEAAPQQSGFTIGVSGSK